MRDNHTSSMAFFDPEGDTVLTITDGHVKVSDKYLKHPNEAAAAIFRALEVYGARVLRDEGS